MDVRLAANISLFDKPKTVALILALLDRALRRRARRR